MLLEITMKDKKYDVIIKRGCLEKANEYLNLNRKVLIITDDGVPKEYLNILKKDLKDVYVYIIKQGEESKSFDNYSSILDYLIENEFSRTDAIIALGGGVVGDLAGFVASTYMRGICFYNIPTTLLSQVDSSIGGKTAIDKKGYKNLVGAFYPPEKVLIDPNVLFTLDNRQFNSGLVEALKMGMTSDQELYELIKNSNDIYQDIDLIIEKALHVKKEIVEKDEKESNLRRVLNFGHTIGHAIESYYKGSYLHGECVGLGMLFLSSNEVKKEIIEVLNKYNLPTKVDVLKDEFISLIKHDKKASGNKINIIFVDEIGSFKQLNIDIEDLKNYM